MCSIDVAKKAHAVRTVLFGLQYSTEWNINNRCNIDWKEILLLNMKRNINSPSKYQSEYKFPFLEHWDNVHCHALDQITFDD